MCTHICNAAKHWVLRELSALPGMHVWYTCPQATEYSIEFSWVQENEAMMEEMLDEDSEVERRNKRYSCCECNFIPLGRFAGMCMHTSNHRHASMDIQKWTVFTEGWFLGIILTVIHILSSLKLHSQQLYEIHCADVDLGKQCRLKCDRHAPQGWCNWLVWRSHTRARKREGLVASLYQVLYPLHEIVQSNQIAERLIKTQLRNTDVHTTYTKV